jgi:hypothetical protein
MSDAPAAAPTLEDAAVRLSKPVQVLTETVSVWTPREPIGKDFSEAGYPTRFDDAGNNYVDGRVMTKFIARLAGWPITSAEQMAARDWNKCALKVMVFLGSGEAESGS